MFAFPHKVQPAPIPEPRKRWLRRHPHFEFAIWPQGGSGGGGALSLWVHVAAFFVLSYPPPNSGHTKTESSPFPAATSICIPHIQPLCSPNPTSLWRASLGVQEHPAWWPMGLSASDCPSPSCDKPFLSLVQNVGLQVALLVMERIQEVRIPVLEPLQQQLGHHGHLSTAHGDLFSHRGGSQSSSLSRAQNSP